MLFTVTVFDTTHTSHLHTMECWGYQHMMKIENQVTVPYIGSHDITERMYPATLHCQL
jgi:hypothetical protein